MKLTNIINSQLLQIDKVFFNRKIVYVIWQNPLIVAANNTFINSIIEFLGGQNCYSYMERYPSITLEELANVGFDLLLLSTEPYPFSNEHVRWYSRQLKTDKIDLVNGEMFSWYGTHLIKAPAYFSSLIK